MNHEEYKQNLELEALGALDETESRALHEHLASCPECRAELSELLDAAAALIYLTPPAIPPAGIRQRILEIAASRPQGIQADVAREEESANTGGADKALPVALLSQINRGAQSSRARSSILRWGALAASVVIAVLLIMIVMLWNRNRAMQAELTSLSRRSEEMQAELTRIAQSRDELQAELTRLSNRHTTPQDETGRLPNHNNRTQDEATDRREANAPPANVPPIIETPVAPESDARVVELAGTDNAPQARAHLAYNNRTGVMTLNVSGMPAPPAGKAYQLWFQVKGHFIPGGVFITGPEGRAMMRGQIPDAAGNASTFVVTLEKSTGANKPTGAKYLLSIPS